MRAIIYTRVSSDKARGRSVQEQERECRDECHRQGWTLAEVLCDNDRSASRFATKDRPEYQRLQQILVKGDVLVTWEASRAQRDLKAYVALRDLCAQRGVIWSYSGRCYDLSRSDDRLATGLDALLSENEADKTRDRIMRAHRANLDAGRPHGKCPYGYRIVRDPDTGRPTARVLDEVEAPIIQNAAHRVLAGESLRSVVARLNADSDGKQWRPNNLRRILSSPVYAGYRTHRGEVVREGTWEPLFTADEHERLIALFAGRVASRGTAPRHLLSGIAQCGVCDGPLHVRSSGYSCERGHVARKEAKVDDAVTKVIVALLSSAENLAKLTAPVPVPTSPTEDVAALQAQLDAAADRHVAGKLSLDMLARLEARILPRIKAAQVVHHDRFPAPVVARVAAAPDPQQAWKSLPLDDKRDFIRATMNVIVDPVSSRWELGVNVTPVASTSRT